MTIVKLKGGLGNQLFQYAFGRYLSDKRNEELLLDIDALFSKGDTYRQYGLDHFNIKARIATHEEVKSFKDSLGPISKLIRGFKTKILRIQNIGWNPKVLNSKKSYFDGYWQSYKYSELIREELLKELTLKERVGKDCLDILEKMNNTNSVSLHIRRGDYVTNAKTSKIHNICDLEYYRKAIKTIVEKVDNPNFFIFSDDIEWVKENLKTEHPLLFVSKPGMKDYEEIILMSKCKHNIIANSSFSWWGAWLNNGEGKVVVTPEKWNNHHQKEYEDLNPKSWIKI